MGPWEGALRGVKRNFEHRKFPWDEIEIIKIKRFIIYIFRFKTFFKTNNLKNQIKVMFKRDVLKKRFSKC